MLNRIGVALIVSAVMAAPAAANDTMAEIATGGLVFVRTDAIAIASEDLFISEKEIRVAYEFRNETGSEVEAIVAFPMPDIVNPTYGDIAIPAPGVDNFLSFTVEANGQQIAPNLEQKAFASELDVTAELKAAAVPVNPTSGAAHDALKRVPEAKLRDWLSRGIVWKNSYDDSEPWVPAWTMKSTYWWKMTFPSGRLTSVKHAYRPSVGATSGLRFFQDDKVGGPYLDEYRYKYCLDPGIERTMNNSAKQNGGYPPYWENWISYILTTGGHWGGSTIEKFTLTIDKGEAQNLVSFCGANVKKIGPTTFQMVAEYFYPERDLDILLLKKFDSRNMPASSDGESANRAIPTPMATPMATPGGDN